MRQLIVAGGGIGGLAAALAAHQAGWRNAVAVLGTATTDHHAALIRRSGAREVVLAFDGDEAGRNATHVGRPPHQPGRSDRRRLKQRKVGTQCG